MNRAWYYLGRFAIRVAARIFFGIRYTGVENIPQAGTVLLVANHQSHLDPPLIGAGIPRTASYLARSTLFRPRPFARLLRSFGAIPLDLARPLGGLKEALRRLQAGDAVLVFPEGTRSPDGEIHPFQKGFRMLAVRSQAMIVPVAIEGSFLAWPRWRRLPRPGRVQVHFGPPLFPQDYLGLPEESFLQEVQARVENCQAEIRSRPEMQARLRKQRLLTAAREGSPGGD